MKNYSTKDHAKLSTKELQDGFFSFMMKEYESYCNADGTIQAHNDGDFGWFVSEFFKNNKIAVA